MHVAKSRRDGKGTPFTNWIRCQPGLESALSVGYVGSDVDLIWYNYRLAMLMLIEEKCFMAEVNPSQEAVQSLLHQALSFALSHDDLTFHSLRKPIPPKVTYCGYHLIQFEKTGPEDGAIFIDGTQVRKPQVISFLQFQWTPGIQCCLHQQEQIRAASSRASLEAIAKQIKQRVRHQHPEMELLRQLYREKMQELKQMEAMFLEDVGETYGYADPDMVEAERILHIRDLEDLRGSA